MLAALMNSLFGCSHEHTTFPITPNRRGRTYVACLDCGKEFDYDWKSMRMGEVASKPLATPQTASAHR
jgi:hypothetical protein